MRGLRPAVLGWVAWALVPAGFAAPFRLDAELRRAGLAAIADARAGLVLMAIGAVSAASVGAVLAGRRPHHPVGWLLLTLALSLTVQSAVYAYVRVGLIARPGSLPGAAYLTGLSNAIVLVWVSCAGFVLLLTPTGRLPSRRWRWWARVAAAALAVWVVGSIADPAPMRPEYPGIANPLSPPGLGQLLAGAAGIGALVVPLALLIGAASLLVRYRRARGVERQQLRWLAVVAGLAPAVLAVTVVGVVTGNFDLANLATGALLVLLPVVLGASILRYRLYDLDRIISRTLGYALLSLMLGLAYAGLVLGLGSLLEQDSSLVVAAATLAVAAAFQPARRRVQGAVDRRFDRRRYDAANTIRTFSARLRQQLDLDTLSGELLGVVEETMQPTQVSLWRPAAILRGDATAARLLERRGAGR